MSLPLTALIAAVVCALLTRAMIPWLSARGAVATENDRTMHSGAIPKGGGLPLLISAIAVTSAIHPLSALPSLLVAGLVIAAIVSWRDDVTPLTAAQRLPLHFLAAACYVWSLPKGALVFQGLLPLAVDHALSILMLAGFMNFFNFMDGINGIAGTEAAAISFGVLSVASMAGLDYSLAPLAAALLGAALGFLVWNMREKALVFLGDVGSIPLGFLTGAFLLELAAQGYWAAALILPAYFIADAKFTIAKRLLRGEKVWEAHKTHFYQRAAQGLKAHMPVVARVATANLMLIGLALLSVNWPWSALALAGAIVSGLLITLERAAKAL